MRSPSCSDPIRQVAELESKPIDHRITHHMSTFHGFYIRANRKATLDTVRQDFKKLEAEQHGDFIGVKMPPKKTPEEMLNQLSRKFSTDVFWLGFQSAMDCFEFHHWKSGRCVRSLIYGMEEERTWERADGKPEPWERQFLFHPKNMECELADAEDDAQQETIQRVYRAAKIQVGQVVPNISSKLTADAIAHHYGFPHYGLS
jgi:hypothetical protein